jgi:hypothetical protein
MTKFLIKLLFVALLLATGTARADLFFRANLTNDQEPPIGSIPPQSPPSSGVAFFVLNDARTSLSYFLDTTGLDFSRIDPATGISNPLPVGDPARNDDALRIHIHQQVAGQNGGIVFGMVESSLQPNFQNTLNDPDDLVVNIANGIISGAWDGNEGNGTTLTAQLPFLFTQGLYINVHTSDFAGGEIRGQIFQVFVPEPGSLALVACALGAICLVVRRKAVNARA